MERCDILIAARHLSMAEAVAFQLPSGWPWPVFSIAEDGETVVRKDPGWNGLIHLQMFEISGWSRHAVIVQALHLAATLYDVVGTPGTAVMLIRSDYKVRGGHEEKWMYAMEMGMAFTPGFVLMGGEQASGFPSRLNGCDMRSLQEIVFAYDVLDS